MIERRALLADLGSLVVGAPANRARVEPDAGQGRRLHRPSLDRSSALALTTEGAVKSA
jgi:hypothetical protein